MQSAFLVHVPKTGGSSIDAVLGDEFPTHSVLRGVQHDGPLEPWRQLASDSIRYLSGHIPASAVDRRRFATRITSLRPPDECLASFISYAERHFPDHQPRKNIERVRDRWSLYGSYFSPGFDTLRYVTERRYGVEQDHYFEYADPCTVAEALSTLDQFEYVIDFRYLHDEMRRLVIEQGLFPRSMVPHLRSDMVPRDLASIRGLMTPFDTCFYEEGKHRFRPIPADIDGDYERYRGDYSRQKGLRIDAGSTARLDLAGPIGTGWSAAEPFELGESFRWANTRRPILDIPIALSGDYRMSIYLKPCQATNLRAAVTSAFSGVHVQMESASRPRLGHHGLTLLTADVSLPESDWLHVHFECDLPRNSRAKQTTANTVFLLGNVQVRRRIVRSRALPLAYSSR